MATPNLIQNLYCSMEPPNVAAKWRFRFCVLRETQPNQQVEFNDIDSLSGVTEIQQFGVFVIFRIPQNPTRPIDVTRLGVWHPTIINGQITDWKLYTTDGDDTQLGIINVAKYDDNQPTVLQTTEFESGFDANNPAQLQLVMTIYSTKESATE